ncbi:hypothetical protein H0B56_12065 [Haloechinothrix sp. YIM 98757]|uniref:Uncharacterized protein n=1 Tax=Haloechinothrix aidingensis TaxID=2752311 RepID=A0A838AAM4_9PSEU|nr:hypothetical protein [Haloechinothrix aidingensis]MBA0126277.1 hypothetical protein [Haloechinothrix aidingensis]
MADLAVQLFYDGQWHDITSDVRTPRQDVHIERGRRDWSEHVDPSSCRMLLNNRHGRYSPRNPHSPLFGKVGRNTPLRVRIGPSQQGMWLPGEDGSYAHTEDASSLDIIGDIDIVFEATPTSWRPDADTLLASKYQISGDNRSWMAQHMADGTLRLSHSEDGTFNTFKQSTSTSPVPADADLLALRIVLIVDDGNGNAIARFYTAASIGDTWSQLGNDVVHDATTSIYASDAPLEIGAGAGGGAIFPDDATFSGTIHAFQLRAGVDGTLVADAEFADQDDLTSTSWTADDGHEWILHEAAVLADSAVRFSGEVSRWPLRWDLSGNDLWAPIQAWGILHRLQQGSKPLRSSLFRDLSSRSEIVGYWPCEDGENASRIASGIGQPSAEIEGEVDLSSYEGLPSSEALPQLTTGRLRPVIPEYDPDADQRLIALLHLPDNGVDGEQRLFTIPTTGSVARWDVIVNSDGSFGLRAYDATEGGDQVLSSIWFAADANGTDLMFSLWLSQQGSDIDWQLGVFEAGADTGSVLDGTLAGHTYGRIRRINTPGGGSDLGGTAVGHIAVMNGDVHSIWDVIGRSMDAWSGESATDRLQRLTADEDIPLRVVSTREDTEAVGAQTPESLLALLRSAAGADLGYFGERADALALLWRPRATLYNQTPRVLLDYSSGEVFAPFEPVEDDQALRNDVTVSRPRGSEYRAVQRTGPLSVAPPPDGVGRYDDAPDVNVAGDAQLPHQAGWRLHLGTIDEPRFPTVRVDLANPRMAARHSELQTVAEGDRMQIINTPAWLPEPVDVIVQGLEENKGQPTHDIVVTCTPASPWTVGVLAPTAVDDAEPDEPIRADTAGSDTAADLDNTATTMLVATRDGPAWTTDGNDLPVDVRIGGGEDVRVTDSDTIHDLYARAETDGWGSPTIGPDWIIRDGPASEFSVDDTDEIGQVAIGAVSDARVITMPVSATNLEILATVSTTVVADGDWIVPGVLMRYHDSDNFYAVFVEFKDTSNIGVAIHRKVDGQWSWLTGAEIDSYSADQQWHLRARAHGTDLAARLWPDSEAEPDTWTISTTDDALDTAGEIGARCVLEANNTNTLPVVLHWHDWTVPTTQQFTVQRAVNGVSRGWDAGTDVRLAHPTIAPL